MEKFLVKRILNVPPTKETFYLLEWHEGGGVLSINWRMSPFAGSKYDGYGLAQEAILRCQQADRESENTSVEVMYQIEKVFI